MTAAERQRDRLEGILGRVRRRHAVRVRAALSGKVVPPDDLRNALARLVCELDPMSIEDICASAPSKRFARASKVLGVRPTTLHRVVTGDPIGRRAFDRTRRALVRVGALPREAS